MQNPLAAVSMVNSAGQTKTSSPHWLVNYLNRFYIPFARHLDQPESMQNKFRDVRIPQQNTTLGIPCGQGSVPPVSADRYSASVVQEAVRCQAGGEEYIMITSIEALQAELS